MRRATSATGVSGWQLKVPRCMTSATDLSSISILSPLVNINLVKVEGHYNTKMEKSIS
jgi:hypothetical protein